VSRQSTRRLLAVSVAALAAILGATTAFAATTWTVQPGGPVSWKSGGFKLTGTRTGAVLQCPSTRMRGTLSGGSGLPGTGIGSIASVNLTQCRGSLPPTPAMTAAGLPWHVNFTSDNATTGVVTGSVSHVQIKIKSTEPRCAAEVNGTSSTASDGMVTFTYADSTGLLKVLTTGGNLHFNHVKGCAGLLGSGDPATLSAIYTTSPKQVITSP